MINEIPRSSRPIVILSSQPFDYLKARPQALALELARIGHVVQFVEFMPGIRSVLATGQRITLINEFGPRQSIGGGSLQIIRTLPSVPIRWPVAGASVRLNELLGRMVLRQLLRSGKVTPSATLLLYAPHLWRAIRPVASAFDYVAYDLLDDFLAFSDFGNKHFADLASVELDLLRRADVVFATADILEERARKSNSYVFRVPNGVDTALFRPENATQVPELTHVNKPVAGFVGTIASWIDTELLAETAERLPDIQFVLVGPTHVNIDQLTALPNVLYFGRQPLGRIPGFISRFHVCLNPFRLNQVSVATDPIKVYEYLAMAKPVVSTPIPEVKRLGDLVLFGSNVNEFCSAIYMALSDPESAGSRRRQFAEDNSWASRAKTMSRAIARFSETKA